MMTTHSHTLKLTFLLFLIFFVVLKVSQTSKKFVSNKFEQNLYNLAFVADTCHGIYETHFPVLLHVRERSRLYDLRH